MASTTGSAHSVLDRVVGLGGEISREALPRLGARVGGRHQRDPWIADKCRQHHGKCAAEAGHAEPELAFALPDSRSASTRLRTFSSLILDI